MRKRRRSFKSECVGGYTTSDSAEDDADDDDADDDNDMEDGLRHSQSSNGSSSSCRSSPASTTSALASTSSRRSTTDQAPPPTPSLFASAINKASSSSGSPLAPSPASVALARSSVATNAVSHGAKQQQQQRPPFPSSQPIQSTSPAWQPARLLASQPASLTTPTSASKIVASTARRPLRPVADILTAMCPIPAHDKYRVDTSWWHLKVTHQRLCLRLFLEDDNLAAVEAVPLEECERDAVGSQRRKRAQLVMEPRVGPGQGQKFSQQWMDDVHAFWLSLSNRQRYQLIKRCPTSIVAYDNGDRALIKLMEKSIVNSKASAAVVATAAAIATEEKKSSKRQKRATAAAAHQVDMVGDEQAMKARPVAAMPPYQYHSVMSNPASPSSPLSPAAAAAADDDHDLFSDHVSETSSLHEQRHDEDADQLVDEDMPEPVVKTASYGSRERKRDVSSGEVVNSNGTHQSAPRARHDVGANAAVPLSVPASASASSSSRGCVDSHSNNQPHPQSHSLPRSRSPSPSPSSSPSSVQTLAAVPLPARNGAPPPPPPSSSLTEQVDALTRQLRYVAELMTSKEREASAWTVQYAQREKELAEREGAATRRMAEVERREREEQAQFEKNKQQVDELRKHVTDMNRDTVLSNAELKRDNAQLRDEITQLRAQLAAAVQSAQSDGAGVIVVSAAAVREAEPDVQEHNVSTASTAPVLSSASFALPSTSAPHSSAHSLDTS